MEILLPDFSKLRHRTDDFDINWQLVMFDDSLTAKSRWTDVSIQIDIPTEGRCSSDF